MSFQGKKILIIDDSEFQATITAEYLRPLEASTSIITKLQRSLGEILSEHSPDLIVLDLRLVNDAGDTTMDGFQLCRQMKQLCPSLHIVVMSAEEDEDTKPWAIKQGADAFLQKPFAKEELVALVSRLLAERSNPHSRVKVDD